MIKPSSDFVLSSDDFERGVNYLSSLTDLVDNLGSYLAEIMGAAEHQNYHADLRKFGRFSMPKNGPCSIIYETYTYFH